jgi:FKBP-type peptidyl-prolyl cis-trans isomerase FkpA
MIKLIWVVLSFLPLACDPPVQQHHTPEPDPVQEQFVKANLYMQRRHQDHIAAFVERVGWNATVTPSGLWIVVEDPGKGAKIVENNSVTFTFSSTLLDGTPCYESTDRVPTQIIVGKGGIESGVEEGMRHLREGSRAIFLIPPHLAHGNFGDRNRIPGNSVLIYKLEVKEVRH